MASTVLGNARPGEGCHVCSLCMSADHLSSACALSSLDSNKALTRPSGPSTRPSLRRPNVSPYITPKAFPGEPCRRFNRGSCSIRPCKFEHTCNVCFKGGHCALDCRLRDCPPSTSVPSEEYSRPPPNKPPSS